MFKVMLATSSGVSFTPIGKCTRLRRPVVPLEWARAVAQGRLHFEIKHFMQQGPNGVSNSEISSPCFEDMASVAVDAKSPPRHVDHVRLAEGPAYVSE